MMFKTSNFANMHSSANSYTNVCKSNDSLMIGMMHQVMTFTAIMISLHILVMFVSILSRMNMAHDNNRVLEKIADALNTANELHVIDTYMCGCSDDDDDDESNDDDENCSEDDSNDDDESDTTETETESEFKTIGETAAAAATAQEDADVKKRIDEAVDELVNEIIASDAAVAAMESKSEEDSIESAHWVNN
jgi:hypothetical protein